VKKRKQFHSSENERSIAEERSSWKWLGLGFREETDALRNFRKIVFSIAMPKQEREETQAFSQKRERGEIHARRFKKFVDMARVRV
jgi:hypothetical protein